MNAVGVDVSKEKSTVAIYQPGDQVILKPRDSCLKTRECAGYPSALSLLFGILNTTALYFLSILPPWSPLAILTIKSYNITIGYLI